MIEPQLFIGFPVEEKFERLVEQTNPYLVKWLILGKDPNYLQYCTFEQKLYLGKKTEAIPNFESLELLHSNVYSLLRRIIPDHPVEGPLYIFPITPEE